MGGSFQIASIAGTAVRIHWTFFLLLAWVGYSDYAASGLSGALDSIAFVITLFACVVAHEFGHITAARRYGIRTPVVTVLPIGGVAALERMPRKPSEEIVVALAGPAVNVVIALVLSLFVRDLGTLEQANFLTDSTDFLSAVAQANIFLCLFNLIPAFPMDGGRVLRAALASWLGYERGTRIAGALGQILAVGFAFAAWRYHMPILFLIALFVFMAAGQESRAAALRR
ncbi:MAG: site-2 protease family protein [Hyphomicrobiales bacterium]